MSESVKEEPEWDTCASDADAETKSVMLEVERMLPRVTSVYTKVECPDVDGSFVKSEVIVEVKEEVEAVFENDSARASGDSNVNDTVYGPELLKLLTNPVDLDSLSRVKREIKPLRRCSVRIERMPAEKKRKPYSCKICYKIFDLKTSLLTHLDAHSAEELHPPETVRKRENKIKTNVECDICGQKCASKSHLVIHYRKHTGERPYACKLCDKSYAQCANLLKHELCHTGEKPFSCPNCMKRFSQKVSLSKHVCIPCRKTYPCEICKLQCNSKMDLIKHIEVHTESIACNICSIRFKDNADLEHHMVIHSCLAQMRKKFHIRNYPTKRKARSKCGKNSW